MATYSSYKKVGADSFQDNTVGSDAVSASSTYGVQWIYNERGFICRQCANAGNCCEQSNGKCCQWTVPDKVTTVTFEIWSGGGGGAGHTCCNNCSFAIGGAGGNYAIKTVTTQPGCQYTVCAGGSWPCEKSHTCTAGMGCRSFVTGQGLSNFCAEGGCPGWMCNGDAWGPRHHTSGCANCRICGFFGADMGMMGTVGFKMGHGNCHCRRTTGWTGAAPIIGLYHAVGESDGWCGCGCYVNWPAGGAMSGQSSYCGNWAKCCAGGMGMGGSGIVRITFI